MATTLQPKILLNTLKYDFKFMQRENSPNEVQKWYLRGTNFFGVQTVQMGYGWQPCIRVKSSTKRVLSVFFQNQQYFTEFILKSSIKIRVP